MNPVSYRQTRFFKTFWDNLANGKLQISPFTKLALLPSLLNRLSKVNVLNLTSDSFDEFKAPKGLSLPDMITRTINNYVYNYSSNLPPNVRAVLEQERDDSDSDMEEFNAVSGADSDSDKEFVEDDSGYLFTSDSDDELLVSEKSDSDVEV